MSEGTAERGPVLAAMLRGPFFWACLVTAGLAAYIYYPLFFPASIRSLAGQSEDFFFQANDAAGAPVLFLSLWLFYRRSHFGDVLRGPGSTGAAAVALLLATALYGWGAYTQAPDLQLASSIGLLIGLVLLLGGRAGLRAYWLPILFLGFALPVSPVLIAASIFPMQLVTAQYAGLILNGIGFDALVRGDQILQSQNTFIVIETCSGVRTMLTLSMLTILLIDLFERRGWHALILIALAPVVAFGVNGIRVVTLVLNPHSSIHSIHNLQGILMLLVGLTLIYLVDGRMERFLGSRDPIAADGDYGMTRQEGAPAAVRAAKLCGIACLLVVMIALGRFIPPWSTAQRLDERPDALLERVLGEDPGPPLQTDYNFAGSMIYLAHARHRVEVDGAIVEVFLGVANEQRRAFSILTKRLAWPATGYVPVDEAFVEVADAGPLARRMVFERGPQSVLSYSWVERRGSLPVEWFRQAAALDRSPLVRPGHMLAIRLSTHLGRDGSNVEEPETRIRRVWERLAPALVGYAELGVAR